jgi:phosphate transport system permease protein
MTIRQAVDRGFRYYFILAGFSAVIILFGIFLMLFINGMRTFADISLSDFFLSARWNPSAFGEPSYGILAMVASTLMVTLGAMIIAVPFGIGTAAYLSEMAGHTTREILKPVIEILASIPSVVVGFFGIVWLGPLIARTFNLTSGLNALNGSILLAVMALPTIISVSEDAIRSVPKEFKEASYALGVNRWLTLAKITLPAAFPGIVAAVMLGVGRAIGETMTVLMATGNALQITGSFFESVRTMTANIAIELGEVPFGTTHYFGLFAVGIVLFIMSLAVNLVAEHFTKKFRHKI